MWFLYLFAFFAGITNTVMAGSNSTLGKKLHQPLAAAVVVYGVGLLAALITLFGGIAVNRAALPPSSAVHAVPWWGWIGGALGAIYIIAGITVPEKIGAASFTGMTVTAAIITSIVMDHFGLVGFKQHSAGIGRIIGACLMFAGLFLIAKF